MKKSICKFLNALASQAEEIQDEMNEKIDDVMEVPDFVEKSTNVYRTKRYIVKQALGIDHHDTFGVFTISHDTFYERTKERDALYDEFFADNYYPEGRRVPAMSYARVYVK